MYQCNFQINGGGSDPNGDWAPDMKTGDTFTSTKLPIAIYINNCDLSVTYAEKVTFTLKSSTPAPVVIKPNCVNECSNHNQRYCVDNKVYSSTFSQRSSLATGTAIQSIDASGTVSQDEWFKK